MNDLKPDYCTRYTFKANDQQAKQLMKLCSSVILSTVDFIKLVNDSESSIDEITIEYQRLLKGLNRWHPEKKNIHEQLLIAISVGAITCTESDC